MPAKETGMGSADAVCQADQVKIKMAEPTPWEEKKAGGAAPLPVKADINANPAPSETGFDPWALPELQDRGVGWSELTSTGKASRICLGLVKTLALLGLLYVFVCSLDFLSTAFRLIGGKAAGGVLSNNELLQNPVVGLMIGILATVLVQSSSTSTSIVVTMVGSNLISVSNAVPIIMGANVGTSVTNTIVALMQATQRDEFRRAFAAATVHDMFNWLTVIVLLPLEAGTGYLEKLTSLIVDSQEWTTSNANRGMLSEITKPFTENIIRLDKSVISDIAKGNQAAMNKSLIKRCCQKNGTECIQKCNYLLAGVDWEDYMLGILLLAISLIMLCTCLILMVKLLHSMLQGRIANVIKRVVNAEPRFPFSILVGYVAILVGCAMTIIVQSSSIFTSALTPLAGVGIVTIERMYPLTLGANIGTTTTGILAALAASDGRALKYSLQIAFCHLFFNISGILLFYPIPATRIPIALAKILGNTTADYRWFSVAYLLLSFIAVPAVIFALSAAGSAALMAVGIPFLAVLAFVAAVNVLQHKRPSVLPLKLRTWDWLPLWMHSLDPIDRVLTGMLSACRCCECIGSGKSHDARHMSIPSNPSQLNIVESRRLSTPLSECHALNGFDNRGFGWVASSKSEAESTPL